MIDSCLPAWAGAALATIRGRSPRFPHLRFAARPSEAGSPACLRGLLLQFVQGARFSGDAAPRADPRRGCGGSARATIWSARWKPGFAWNPHLAWTESAGGRRDFPSWRARDDPGSPLHRRPQHRPPPRPNAAPAGATHRTGRPGRGSRARGCGSSGGSESETIWRQSAQFAKCSSTGTRSLSLSDLSAKQASRSGSGWTPALAVAWRRWRTSLGSGSIS